MTKKPSKRGAGVYVGFNNGTGWVVTLLQAPLCTHECSVHPLAPPQFWSYTTKRGAVAVALHLAKTYNLELVIKNRDGKIAQKDSHGCDPRKVRG
jgi:hypothetical protein